MDCSYTKITSLDVSKNEALNGINCSNTGITGLDISKNTNIMNLEYTDTPLAYLNVGSGNYWPIFPDPLSTNVDIEVTADNFKIQDKISGIDPRKVTIKSDGVHYNSETGEVSGYTIGTTIITYEYDCGTSAEGKLTLNVSLTLLKGTSSIAINDKLDKTYNGETVKNMPNVDTTGSKGNIIYKWEKKTNATDWTSIDSAPAEAGAYRVTATVAADSYYNEASSAPVEFEITKAAAPAVTLPGNLSGVQDNKLSTVLLPDGWTWTDGGQSLTVRNSGYQARLAVDDSNYDYSNVDGYDSTGHSVERTLTVTISAAANGWTTEPSITGWTYNEQANAPSGSAVHGTVEFTYSDSETGTFTADVPAAAGTWYLKASVPASEEYTGLNTIVPSRWRGG